jgi:polysaccharide biosynthesis transport protein
MRNESALVEYWLILVRRKYTIVLITVAAAALGYVLSRLQVPVYRARATVETIRPGGTLSIRTSWDIPTRSSAWQMRRTIRKRALTDKVSSQIKARYAGQPMQARPVVTGLLYFPPVPLDNAIAMAAATLRVRETDAAGIVEILCDSSDPRVSADFANGLMQAYVEEDLQQQLDGAQIDKAGVVERLDKLGVRIQAKGLQLRQYASDSILKSASKDGVAAQRLEQLTSELAKVRRNRDVREHNFELASAVQRESLAGLPEGFELRSLETELTELTDERAKLLQDYLPKHPLVVTVERRIATVEAALDQRRDNVVARLRTEYQTAAQSTKLMQRAFDGQENLVTQQLGFSTGHQILQEELNQDLDAYESLLKDSGLNTVITAIRSPKLRVVDAAEPVNQPHEPVTLRETGNGAINGFFLVVAYLLIGSRLNRTLRKKGDITRLVGAPELAAIPAARRPLRLRIGGGVLPKLQFWRRARPSLEAAWHEDARRAHGFMECAEQILLSYRPGSVIAVTSPTQDEKKTSVVANLGIALAEMGRRVLLIDADTFSPQLHEYFGISNEHHFFGSLRALGALEMPGSHRLKELGVPNLFLMPGNRGEGQGSRLLRDEKQLEAMLGEFRQEFDVILMEGPAIFVGGAYPIHLVDSRVLARQVDASIVVFRSGQTTQAEAIPALRHLVRDGGRILGTILIDCPAEIVAEPYGAITGETAGGKAA